MNPLLTTPDTTEEFVITPEPNAYIVGLKISAEQAEAFAGHDFLAIRVIVEPEGGAGVACVYDVLPDGDVGEYRVNGEDFNEAQGEVLNALQGRAFTAINKFFAAVEPDLPEYYDELGAERALRTLRSLIV